MYYRLNSDFSVTVLKSHEYEDICITDKAIKLFPVFTFRGESITIVFDDETGWFSILVSFDNQEGHIHPAYCQSYEGILFMFEYYVKKSIGV